MTEPIHILSLGAGVQSSTLALMAAHGEVEPHPIGAIFADTQDEPASVYRWLEQLIGFINAAPHPFPVHVVTRGKLSEYTLEIRTARDGRTYTKTTVPFFTKNADGSKGIATRACTSEFKLAPIIKKARELGGVPRGCKEVRVVQWIGISLDEVVRMKPSRHAWAKNRWPLIEAKMSRHDCKRWMEAKGYPEPPRSACTFCPYHNNHEWRQLRDDAPEEFAKAVEFERLLQTTKAATGHQRSVPFLHSSLVPLAEVDFTTDEDHGQGMLWGNFTEECEGMCGV